ncbi:CLUMA_CG020005, isoform A [Clunio marinus]|uniref:Protein-lysine N-methyltransferase SMYD4 n=1 Tax=Clunio marinus TaxID=568069 RepID=A0A1J1J4V7_9DIPT|nr:CLUMA_CG020005, isoform A [Clunio marinus]
MDGMKSGFFLNFYQKIRNNLKSEEIQAFTESNSNQERFNFAYRVSHVHDRLKIHRHERGSPLQPDKDEIFFYKDLKCAMEMKKVGNKFFQNQQWMEALNFYNKSYIMMPKENSTDISIIFANRSAVLYHTQQYDAALKEIERAVDENYPKDLMYKLKERKARCLLAKKNHVEALKAFQEDVKALDDSSLPHEKKMKLERDAQIMIKLMQKNLEIEAKTKKSLKTFQVKEAKKDKKEVVDRFICDAVSFEYTESEGRFAKAGKDIKLGTYLVQEKPHVACLLQIYSQTHCQTCFKRTNVPITCPNCADVIFCSEKCRDEALKTFHQFDFDFIGSLVYHNLQFTQFNAHEISELQYKGKGDVGTSTFIGGGLYPTVAFFNHSCDPGVVRYFNGNVIMVRALKHIPAGEVVAENYGPIFTQVAREERQAQLMKQYHFKCLCKPCLENWPMFREMDDNILRFRCDGHNRTCKNVLLVPLDVNEFMIKCIECGESTNIMKGLKALQDTDMIFKAATRLLEAGDTKNSLGKFVENLDLMDQSLVPPFRSYHLTQQGIRRCIIEFGNKTFL